MLRYLGKVDNVLRFQKFCGLDWTEDSLSSDESEKEFKTKDSKEKYPTHNRNSSSEDDFKDFDLEENNKKNASLPKNTTKFIYTYNRFVHELFKFGSELGNELFYITFLPFVFWNVDDYIGRRLIILWVFNMYAGQGLKDVLCWPRPPSPPVLRLEEIYESEYGMPSTHAIAGSIIPFGLVYFSYDRFQVNIC